MRNNEAYETEYEEELQNEPEVIATSPIIQLISTLAALSSLFALFLFFADKKSRAVRRTSVQSIGMGALFLVLSLLIFTLNAIFSALPIIKLVAGLVLTILHWALAAWFAYVKVKLMFHAYRGTAYTVPLIGEHIRRFE
jgi:Predicted membrane protein